MPQILPHKLSLAPPQWRVCVRRLVAGLIAAAGLWIVWTCPHNTAHPVDMLLRLAVALGGMCLALVLWRRRPDDSACRRADPAIAVPPDDAGGMAVGHLVLWLAGAGVAVLLGAAVWAQYETALSPL